MGTVSTFIFTSDTETVTRTKLNNLVANLLTEFNGNIDNANIKANAAIAATKLDLSTVAQDVTFTGTIDLSGATLTAATTFADLTATTIDINGGAIDGAVIGGSSAAAGTFTNLTATGTINFSGATVSDLGSITTADINGGTIDGTNIGVSSQGSGHFSTLKLGTTNQGDILYDNGTSIVRLTPGTSGYFLKTQGAAANPIWAEVEQSWSLLSTTTYSTENSKTITGFATDKVYKIVGTLEPTVNNGFLTFQFNGRMVDGVSRILNQSSGVETDTTDGTIKISSGQRVMFEGILTSESTDDENHFSGTCVTHDGSNKANGWFGMFEDGVADLSTMTIFHSEGTGRLTGDGNCLGVIKKLRRNDD